MSWNFLFRGIEVNSSICSKFSDSSVCCENICTNQNLSIDDKNITPAKYSEDKTSSSVSDVNITQHNLQNINDNENSNDGDVLSRTVIESKEEVLKDKENRQRYLSTTLLN